MQEKNNNKQNQSSVDMVDWWFSALGISFLPYALSVVLDVLHQVRPNWGGPIANGDLIMVAFVVCFSVTMHGYIKETHALCKKSKLVFYCSLYTGIFIAIIYASVKSQTYSLGIVLLFSFISLASALPLSYASEYFLKVNNNG